MVYGAGTLAVDCARLLVSAGARNVTLIAPGPTKLVVPGTVRVITGWGISEVHGRARVEAVMLRRGDRRERLLTDALVLARGGSRCATSRAPLLRTARASSALHSQGEPKSGADALATAADALQRTLMLLGSLGSRSLHKPVEQEA